MILLAPCIIDFIGPNGLRFARAIWAQECPGPPPPTGPRSPFGPMKSIIQGQKNQWSIGSFM